MYIRKLELLPLRKCIKLDIMSQNLKENWARLIEILMHECMRILIDLLAKKFSFLVGQQEPAHDSYKVNFTYEASWIN